MMPDDAPLFLDGSALALDDALTQSIVKRGARAASDALSKVRDQVLREQLGSMRTDCYGEAASQALKQCVERVSSVLRTWAGSDSSLRWLWTLRRTPERVFEGTLATTLAYDATLAEIVSGHSAARSAFAHESRSHTQFAYPLDAGLIGRLSRFCEGIRYLSDLHQCYRWSGKGATLRFATKERPEILVDNDIRTAVEAYDQRVAKAGQPLARLGTVLTTLDSSAGDAYVLLVQRTQATEVPTVMPGQIDDPGSLFSGRTVGRYLPLSLPLQKLVDLARDPRSRLELLFSKDAAALLYLLWCAPVLMMRHGVGLHGILTNGYLMWTDYATPVRILTELFESTDSFVRDILAAARLQTPGEVIDALTSIRGSEWPLAAGPIFRREGRVACLDLAAASLRLDTALEFPAIQDRYANARADHFEDQVQEAIDSTSWKPLQQAAQLRGRTLSLHGNAVTDIDAIGTRGDAVLLISCKSMVYTAAHDVGDYRLVRNAASDIAKYVKQWQNIVERFRGHPRGDNYDLSLFPNILGVVCTPHVTYANKDTLDIQAAQNLPMAISIEELRDWLKSSERT